MPSHEVPASLPSAFVTAVLRGLSLALGVCAASPTIAQVTYFHRPPTVDQLRDALLSPAVQPPAMPTAAGTEALIGSTAAELAHHAITLLGDDALCAGLAQGGNAVLRRRFDEGAARRVLMELLGEDLCPCCGRRAAAHRPLLACEACGADALDRALAEAAIRPWRGLAVNSLHEAVPVLGKTRIRVPDGPLRRALGPVDGGGASGLLVSYGTEADPGLLRPGGRWVCPAPADEGRALTAAGWAVRLHGAGPPVIEAEKPGAGD